jgi:hypothetical protein
MLNIVYCDDESAYASKFTRNHGDTNNIVTTDDVDALPDLLAGMKPTPDLLVLDLYHTAFPRDSDDARRVNAEVERQVRLIGDATSELKKVVEFGKRPAALDALRTIRCDHRLADLPVLLYTRQGLSLLDDDQLNRAAQLGAEWMLKGRGAGFEHSRMLSFVHAKRADRYRRRRELLMVGIGAVAAVVLEHVWQLAAQALQH